MELSSTGVSVETDKYLKVSAKVEDEDLDWEGCRQVGLTPDEVFIITYFSDIEYQTINYMRDLLATEAALEEDVSAFLSMWNYEEFYHGRALARILRESGHDLEQNRIAKVRKTVTLRERLEAIAAGTLSRVFRSEFPAVYTAWGAIQEMTALHAYSNLGENTANPALKVLCQRIAKQERRHYAWYYNNARMRLKRSTRAQKLTRFLLQKAWSPVGAGVKTPDEVAKLFFTLFPGAKAEALANEVDGKLHALPGLAGVRVMRKYVDTTKTHKIALAAAHDSRAGQISEVV